MNKVKIAKIICLAALLIVLGACGQDKDDGRKTIELFNNKSENQLVYKKIIKDFEAENPDVRVVFTSPPDAGTVLRTRLVKNDIPTIIAYGGDITYTELADVGMLEDLSEELFSDKVLPAYLDMTKALQKDQESLYGIPYASNAAGVIYNEDIFKEQGLEIPTTWDEFIDVAKSLQAAGITPIEGTFKDSWTILSIFNPLAGILTKEDFMKQRRENKVTFQDGWKQPMTQLADIMTYTQKDSMGTSYADGVQDFANGKAAMIINGTWAIPEIMKSNKELKVNIFPLPASNDVSENDVTSGVDVMFTIGKGTKNQEEAKRFIEFMLLSSNAQDYIDDQFAFSALKDVPQKEPSLSGVSSVVESGKVNDFVDHFVPNGYDIASLLSEFALEQTSHPEQTEQNVDRSLKKMDKSYDVANID